MRKISFIHIPKTGGTTTNKIFKNKIISLGHNLRDKNFKYLKEIPKEEDEFRFCFVRNPWDRAVSAFFYLNQGGKNKGDDEDANRFIYKYQGNFDAFVKKELQFNPEILNQIHFKEQHKWICDDKFNILVDYIGKIEFFSYHISKLVSEHGLKLKLQKRIFGIKKVNSSNHEHYSRYYTDETKKIVKKIYKKDIELFNYSFNTN